ncbi:hypothetical protein GCM10027596_35030 [Nocardioides korecus]
MSVPADPSDPRDPRDASESPSVEHQPVEPESAEHRPDEVVEPGSEAPDGGDQSTGSSGATGAPEAPASTTGPSSPGPDAARDEDALWRAIVANYGERARLDPDAPGSSATTGPTTPVAPRPSRPSTRPSARRPGPRDLPDGSDLPEVPPSLRDLDGPAHREPPEDGEHFVPPPPPPVPVATPPRLLAWIGLFGVPVLVLVALVVGWPVPSWLGLLLTLWFVGGFVFLVASMRPGQRDEDDDGAVL